jgi:hypothetical protein
MRPFMVLPLKPDAQQLLAAQVASGWSETSPELKLLDRA